MTVKHGSTAWRILVELAGRGTWISERDLCETLALEPSHAHDVLRDLWLDHRITHPYYYDMERWQITWQGQDALRRLDEPPEHAATPSRRWCRRWEATTITRRGRIVGFLSVGSGLAGIAALVVAALWWEPAVWLAAALSVAMAAATAWLELGFRPRREASR